MKLIALIGRLETILQDHGDVEVEVQDKDATCHPDFHSILEPRGDGAILKLRSWPY